MDGPPGTTGRAVVLLPTAPGHSRPRITPFVRGEARSGGVPLRRRRGDVQDAASVIEPGSPAGILVYGNRWAASLATAVSNRVSRRQTGRWAQQEQEHQSQAYEQQQAYAQAPPPPPPPAADDMSDKVAQIKELGQLKEQGLLTDAEFQQQKSRLLGL